MKKNKKSRRSKRRKTVLEADVAKAIKHTGSVVAELHKQFKDAWMKPMTELAEVADYANLIPAAELIMSEVRDMYEGELPDTEVKWIEALEYVIKCQQLTWEKEEAEKQLAEVSAKLKAL